MSLVIKTSKIMSITIAKGGDTSLNLLSMSAVGFAFPHSLKTSSLSRSCHCGYMLSKNIVQVSKWDVVSCPAKKNVLHSSIISSMVRVSSSRFCPCSVTKQASSIAPSRSSPYPFPFDANRVCMIVVSVFLSFFSSVHFNLLVLVGRYLQINEGIYQQTIRMYRKRQDYCWPRNMFTCLNPGSCTLRRVAMATARSCFCVWKTCLPSL